MDPPENKNNPPPVSNSQEQDDYLFHLDITSILSVEEHVSIEELLGNQKPDVGSMKASVKGGRKPQLPSCTSSQLYGRQARWKRHLSQVPLSTERHMGPSKIEVQATKDFTQSSYSFFKRNRKVHMSDLTEERGSCRNCDCQIGRCLKYYCDCFAAGVYCTEPCLCQKCLNKPINEDIVLKVRRWNDRRKVQRSSDSSSQTIGKIESCNPHLFLPKVIRSYDTSPQIASPQIMFGDACSISNKCQGCKNFYGRKDTTAEKKSELEETEALQISKSISNLQDEGESLFEYMNNLSPLKFKKRIEATKTLNSIGMDYSLLSSPDACHESRARNYLVDSCSSEHPPTTATDRNQIERGGDKDSLEQEPNVRNRFDLNVLQSSIAEQEPSVRNSFDLNLLPSSPASPN